MSHADTHLDLRDAGPTARRIIADAYELYGDDMDVPARVRRGLAHLDLREVDLTEFADQVAEGDWRTCPIYNNARHPEHRWLKGAVDHLESLVASRRELQRTGQEW